MIRLLLQDDETGQTVEVSGSYEVLGDRCARQQAHEVDPPEISGNSRAGTAVETLERLAALHGRRVRLVQRAEAPTEVRAPRDLEVLVQRPCRLEFLPAYEEAILGRGGAVGDRQHFAEWETFTRALLTVHRCIFRLALHIFAVPPRSWELL
ncbi:hypothetical protein MTO96_025891 [Rhipicephalus appendiculatus]